MVRVSRGAVSLVASDAESGLYVRHGHAVDGEVTHRERVYDDCVRAVYAIGAYPGGSESLSLAEAPGGPVVRSLECNASHLSHSADLEQEDAMTENRQALIVLTMNTLAFTVCFAVWTMNGVLVTFLVDQGVFSWDKAQIGWLIGIPVLTGSVMRLPIGVLTDKYGGRIV